jgi:hypothetical protein
VAIRVVGTLLRHPLRGKVARPSLLRADSTRARYNDDEARRTISAGTRLASNAAGTSWLTEAPTMIRKLKSGEYRLYSKKKDPKTGKRRNLGTFANREAAEKHERDVQYFKRH